MGRSSQKTPCICVKETPIDWYNSRPVQSCSTFPSNTLQEIFSSFSLKSVHTVQQVQYTMYFCPDLQLRRNALCRCLSKNIKEANRGGRPCLFLWILHCFCLLFEHLYLRGGRIQWKENFEIESCMLDSNLQTLEYKSAALPLSYSV